MSWWAWRRGITSTSTGARRSGSSTALSHPRRTTPQHGSAPLAAACREHPPIPALLLAATTWAGVESWWCRLGRRCSAESWRCCVQGQSPLPPPPTSLLRNRKCWPSFLSDLSWVGPSPWCRWLGAAHADGGAGVRRRRGRRAAGAALASKTTTRNNDKGEQKHFGHSQATTPGLQA